MQKANISENLQSKLMHVLKLEELRSSPTASTSSAPIFVYGMKESSSDDEDKQSTHSDSLVSAVDVKCVYCEARFNQLITILKIELRVKLERVFEVLMK